MEQVYLDYAATHPCFTREFLKMCYKDTGNPSSTHELGLALKRKYDYTIECLKKTLFANDITITSGATESNNLAARIGIEYCLEKPYTNGIAYSSIEHPSISKAIEGHSKNAFLWTYELGLRYFFGKGWEERLRNMLKDASIGFLSVMTVNNETGIRFPVEKIYKICRELGVLFHTDASQSWLQLKLNPNYDKDNNLYMITYSGHKIGASIGSGILVNGQNLCRVAPCLLYGGEQQELRSGTLNYSTARELDYVIFNYKLRKQYHFSNGVRGYKKAFIDLIKQYSGEIITYKECYNYSPYILSFYLKNFTGEFVQKFMSKNGIYISAGSACSRGNAKGSKTIKELGYTERVSKNVLRISFSPYMTKEEFAYTYKRFKEVLIELNELS